MLGEFSRLAQEYYPKTMGASIIRESVNVMRGDFDSYIRGGGESFRTFTVLNLLRNTRHKGIKILWRLVIGIYAEHDGIYVCIPRGDPKIREISATFNVQVSFQ